MAWKGKVSNGIKVSWGAIHQNKEGEIISAQRDRNRWFLYFFGNWDVDRVAYCELYRNTPLPEDFRTGELTLSMIWRMLKMKINGEFNGLQELS